MKCSIHPMLPLICALWLKPFGTSRFMEFILLVVQKLLRRHALLSWRILPGEFSNRSMTTFLPSLLNFLLAQDKWNPSEI